MLQRGCDISQRTETSSSQSYVLQKILFRLQLCKQWISVREYCLSICPTSTRRKWVGHVGHSSLDIFSEEWSRDLSPFVHLLSASTVEVDVKEYMVCIPLLSSKVLESKEVREATYDSLLQIIGRLCRTQMANG